jgi:alginate O-acetyltransferase complex protein AlgJ
MILGASGYLADRPRPRWFYAVLSALFIVAIVLPSIFFFSGEDSATAIFENREPEPWPQWPQDRRSASSYAAQAERSFNDHFGLRGRLLELDHWIKTAIFRTSPVPAVLLGRSGWLYFLGEDARALDRWYRGLEPFSDAEIAALRDELLRRREYLASAGIPYVVVVVPEKYSVYPEFLPLWATQLTRNTPLDRVVEAMRAAPELDFVDLRPELRSAKARERVYYMTDSHWNYVGAMVGYRRLTSELARVLPGFRAAPVERPAYAPGVDYYSGDLARMLGLRSGFREDDVAPIWKILVDPSRRCAQRDTANETPGYEIYVFLCTNPPRYRALVYHDSMAIPLIPMLAENFSRSVFVSTQTLDPQVVERYKPHIVIEELVERTLSAPAMFPLRR